MATPSKTGKTLIQYNCKNGVYSVDGTEVEPLTFLSSITTDKNTTSTDIYGDGELQVTLLSDRGSTGTLEMTARDQEFEVALGFMQELSNGMGEVQVVQNKTISIGFETYYMGNDGAQKTKKVWFLGVNVSPAGETLSQNTDAINNTTASYPITIKGVNLKATGGTSDYVDANGNTKKVFKISSVPTDSGYATFLDSVPTPTVKAE